MAHMGLAMVLRNNVWALDDAEATKMAAACEQVMRHYDIPKSAPIVADWIGLAICCGSIYGARITALTLEAKMKRAATAEANAAELARLNADAGIVQ